MWTNVLDDIKLHIQDEFRDIFFRIIVLAMALVLIWVFEYPRRKLDQTIDKYFEILEAMKARFRIYQEKEYFLLKRVLYELEVRDEQNIIAATLNLMLEENNVKGTENKEKIQKEIMMESEIKPIEDKCLPGEPHQSIFSIGRSRYHLEHKTKCLSNIKINKYEDVANNSNKNESNKRVAVSSQEHGEIAEHFSPTYPSPDMQKTLKTKHSNQRPSDSSIYRVKFNSREKIKKRYSFSKNSEIWKRRCKYVLAKLIGPNGDDSLHNLCSLFNKHSHIPILKTSLFSLRKEGNIKNENKSIDVIKKSKNSYLALNHDTKVMKLNSNCKRNYSERKLANNKQNFHELSDKGNILLENVAVGNCFGTCDVSTNSCDIDDCVCTEDLNSSLSDANEFYTANNNNFSQTVSEVNIQPQSCYHSQFLVEDQLQNKNKSVQKQDHSKTKVRDKCLFRDRQETINKTNKRSEFGINRLDLDNFNNFEESDSLKIWEGIDDHSEVSISRTASEGYEEESEESDQTGYLRDEYSNFDLSIPALEKIGEEIFVTEKDSLELVETTYEGNNLFRTSTSSFSSQSSADLMEQYQPNEVEEEETGIKVSYIRKPSLSTIAEVTEASSNSFTESEFCEKVSNEKNGSNY